MPKQDVKRALVLLGQAIELHDEHIEGEISTSEASQAKLMGLMMGALGALGGKPPVDTDDDMGKVQAREPAGTSTGGQFASGSGGTSEVVPGLTKPVKYKSQRDWKAAVRAKHGNSVKFGHPGPGAFVEARLSNGKVLPHRFDTIFGTGDFYKSVDADEPMKFLKAEVTSVDAELGLVFGWGIVCKVDGEPYFDLQGDHIPEDSMLEATTDFMLKSRVAGDMHLRDEDGVPIQDGSVVFSFPLTEQVAKSMGISSDRTGWMVAIKPGPETLKAFKEGRYTGFSIGGGRIEDEDA